MCQVHLKSEFLQKVGTHNRGSYCYQQEGPSEGMALQLQCPLTPSPACNGCPICCNYLWPAGWLCKGMTENTEPVSARKLSRMLVSSK